MAKAPLTPLVLHAVIGADHDTALPTLPGGELDLVAFRDVAAVVQAFLAGPNGGSRETLLDPAEVAVHGAVVDALHRAGPVLPAPAAVVARDRGTILRWLEVHHVTLCEALTFVDGRSAARVHVTRPPAPASSAGRLDVPPLDLDGTATELFRVLRRHAAASTMVRHPETEAERASAAFLVESDRWAAFAEAVEGEARRSPGIHVELTGPWAPYDFVKMQFGG